MKFKLIFLYFLSLFSLIFLFVFSQEIEYPPLPGAPQIEESTPFPQYAKYLFNFFILISGIIALGVLIWAGILWILSAGDPSKIEEAKSKAITSFLGLVILLASYLIVVILNPELSIFYLEEIEPKEGVWLIKGNKKICLVQNTAEKINCPEINFDQIEFISGREKLLEVYLYEEEKFGGSSQKIVNPGKEMVESILISQVKSIFFFWKRPGVYLYDLTNFQLSQFPYPVFVDSSLSLKDKEINKGNSIISLNNKVDSVKIFHPSEKVHYGVVFFDEDFKGNCGITFTLGSTTETEIPDLTSPISPTPPYYISYLHWGMDEEDKLTSLYVFTHDLEKEYEGKVIFYDKVGCPPEANKAIIDLSGKSGGIREGSFAIEVKSFKITGGNFKVVLMTDISGPDPKCDSNWIIDKKGCVNSLEYSEVYSSTDDTVRPKHFFIFSFSD